MPLVLRIENVDTLPDGGPVFVEIDRRGIDIGRDTYLDWTLPDPDRFISGKHCEIHFRDGAYWLHDVSTNGTSVNGQPGRLTEPHRLVHGDRIHIGPYIVQTELSGIEAGPGGPGPIPDKGGTSVGGDPWGGVEDAAEAIDRRDFTAKSQAQGSHGDPADFTDENISWGFGDVSPQASATEASDWGEDAGSRLQKGSDVPAEPTGGVDWGAPMDNSATSGSPWDLPDASLGAGSARSEDPPVPATDASAASVPAAEAGHNPFLDDQPPQNAPVDEPIADAAPLSATPVTPIPGEEPHTDADTDVFGSLTESKSKEEPAISDLQAQSRLPSSDGQEAVPIEAAIPPAVQSAKAPSNAPNGSESASPTVDGSFISAFERGAGLPSGSISGRTDEVLAEELGQLIREVTQSLQAMLLARAETKSAMRSSERTMIGALENNPLKFSPTPEDAMRIMFGQKTRSYLDASQTINQSFADLQKHQMQTFGAMQSALQVLIEDLDPENIAGATAKDGGLAGLVGSRRAKFWDTYVERFSAKSGHHDRGMIDAFMILFAEMYDRQG